MVCYSNTSVSFRDEYQALDKHRKIDIFCADWNKWYHWEIWIKHTKLNEEPVFIEIQYHEERKNKNGEFKKTFKFFETKSFQIMKTIRFQLIL